MMQLCLRCGRHEYAGSFCTFCRTAAYDLAVHEHSESAGNACPLGPYLDPLDTDANHIAAFLAKPMRPWPPGVKVEIVHHPRHPGSAEPPLPAWMSRRIARKPHNAPGASVLTPAPLAPTQLVLPN